VAEELATEEIQRIGGSEALDEPYMKIAFHGWSKSALAGDSISGRDAELIIYFSVAAVILRGTLL
jgi:hypothetical protein